MFQQSSETLSVETLTSLFHELVAASKDRKFCAISRRSARTTSPLCTPLEAWGDIAISRIQSASSFDILTDEAVIELREYTMRRIAAVHELVLEHEFADYRERKIIQLLSIGKFCDLESNEILTDFISDLNNDLLQIYLDYPVLGRITAETFFLTVAFIVRAIGDVKAALPVLAAGKTHKGAVTGFRPGQGDPHSGQKTTIRVEIARHCLFFYKPRNGRSQELWDRVAGPFLRYGEQGGPPTVNGLDHYIVPATARHTVSSPREAIRLAEKAGRLLGLASLLRVSDLHAENIVWGRGGPTVVDAEAVLSIARNFQEIEGGGNLENGWAPALGEGLLNPELTALLPRMIRYGRRKYCVGGLSPTGAPSKRARIIGRNTNSRRRVRSSVVFDPGTCWPVNKNLALSANESLLNRALLRGIWMIQRSLYEIKRLLMHELSDGGRHLHIRFIFQDTSHYWRLVFDLRKPDYLRSTEKFAGAIFSSTKLLMTPIDTLNYFRSVGEAAALSRGEIPIFRYDFATGAGVDSDLPANARIHSAPPIDVAERDIDIAIKQYTLVPWAKIVASAAKVAMEAIKEGRTTTRYKPAPVGT